MFWAQKAVLDFSLPLQEGRTWKIILPLRMWVILGSHDVFVDSIQRFVKLVEESGANVTLKTIEGQNHSWDGLADIRNVKAYVSLEAGKEPKGLPL